MREHIEADEPFVREDVLGRRCARALRQGGPGLQGRADRGPGPECRSRPAVDTVSLYTNGPFTDLCRGPHAPSTKRIKAFKLQSVAGAYWRGDAANPMLTRVYGTAFFSAKDLRGAPRAARARTRQRPPPARVRSSACSRSRRSRPGPRSGCPPGPRCSTRWSALSREMGRERGYHEVKTPQIYDSSLWKTSGHWDKYRENMFVTEYEDRQMAVKPMNCPGHCQLYSLRPHSYRDLPVRYWEPGLLHRREPSGTLHGLLRVRHFAQDDSHIFCTEEQIQDEVAGVLEFAFATYEVFGIDVRLELSTRPEQRIGSDELWDQQRGGADAGARERRASTYEVSAGRGRLLRPEDRHAHDRLARPLVAARHLPARLQLPGALRPHLHRRRQRRAPPGDDPPGADGLLRAVHRDPARAPRRRAAGVAGSGAGDRAADRRPPHRLRRRGCEQRLRGRRPARRAATSAPSRSGARSATPSCARSPTCWSWAIASRRTTRSRCASTGAATPARPRVRDLRRAGAECCANPLWRVDAPLYSVALIQLLHHIRPGAA